MRTEVSTILHTLHSVHDTHTSECVLAPCRHHTLTDRNIHLLNAPLHVLSPFPTLSLATGIPLPSSLTYHTNTAAIRKSGLSTNLLNKMNPLCVRAKSSRISSAYWPRISSACQTPWRPTGAVNRCLPEPVVDAAVRNVVVAMRPTCASGMRSDVGTAEPHHM